MYYRDVTVVHHSMESQEGTFDYVSKSVPTGNVYELVKPGQMTPVRVIFSQPYYVANEDPAVPPVRNPNYVPNWILVTVTLKAKAGADAEAQAATLDALKQESDIVTVDAKNVPTVKNFAMEPTFAFELSLVVTKDRVNRPFMVTEVTQ
jgi:hypothetical protein